MKMLALMMLMVVGCATLTSDEKALRGKVVGTYVKKVYSGTALRIVFLENGKSEGYVNGEITKRANWKLVGKEVHFFDEESSSVCKIEPNGDLTVIAQIENKERMDYPKEEQLLWKKIK